MTKLYCRLLKIILWLIEHIWDIPDDGCTEKTTFIFSSVHDVGTNNKTTGDIKEMKRDFGAKLDLNAVPAGPAGSDYEHGSAKWQMKAMDNEGNDASDAVTLTVDPSNELKARFQHTGTKEVRALVTLEADGDPDADEEANVVGSLDIIIDAPNVTGFNIEATDAVDETEEEPV